MGSGQWSVERTLSRCQWESLTLGLAHPMLHDGFKECNSELKKMNKEKPQARTGQVNSTKLLPARARIPVHACAATAFCGMLRWMLPGWCHPFPSVRGCCNCWLIFPSSSSALPLVLSTHEFWFCSLDKNEEAYHVSTQEMSLDWKTLTRTPRLSPSFTSWPLSWSVHRTLSFSRPIACSQY